MMSILLSVSYYLTSHNILGNVEKPCEDTEWKESMPLLEIDSILYIQKTVKPVLEFSN